jgi:hypothetical protein
MPVRRTALLALLVALAAALSLVAGTALGAKPHSTTVIVSLKFPAFHGKVKSADDGCVGARTVKMFRKKAGKPAKLLGSDTTDAKGKWQIPVGKHLTSGSYYAKATAKGECRAGKSSALTID